VSLHRARLALFSAAAASALAGTALRAQDTSDKARLDEFAVPTSQDPLKVDQVAPHTVAPAPAQVRDRTLAQPVHSEAAGRMPAQVSSPKQGGEVAQLATRSQSRAALAGAAANPADRVPGAVQRIGGQDRCDPAQEKAAYAECLRILELRADEFHAPEAPTLSPEQRLLGEMRQIDPRFADTAGTPRMRFATTGQPDADLQSNQELAAVVLSSQPTNQEPTDTPAAEENSKLADVLQALGLQVTVPPGSGN
jgi:hypothetical protein